MWSSTALLSFQDRLSPRRSSAFTLIELLVVVGISLVMTAITIPALNALKNSSDATSAAYDISGMLQFARSYAMTNDTYVYVGVEEADASVSPGSGQQHVGTGRLALSAVASKDGTPGYTVGSSGITGWAGASGTSSLVQIAKLLRVENLHAATSLGAFPSTGSMSASTGRRDVSTKSPSYELMAATSGSSATPFNYPLNSTSPQYSFTQVIQFDPQGAARFQIPNWTDTSEVPWCIELFLQQTHGTTPQPYTNTGGSIQGNVVSIQVDGMTGGVRIFRP